MSRHSDLSEDAAKAASPPSRFSLDRAVGPFAYMVERYYPEPFIFVVLLTLLTAALALIFTPSGIVDVLAAWGEGLFGLMAFIAQIAIMLVASHALALTPPVARLVNRLAALPRTSFQVYALVAFVTGVFSLFAWSFGLVAGAILAKAAAISAEERRIGVHYPLLVATAYAGITVWHMGYSGSAPLFVATPGHSLEAAIGVIPVSETIFSRWNMISAALALAVITILCPLMHPRGSLLRPPLDQLKATLKDEADQDQTRPVVEMSPGERLNHRRSFNLILGTALTGFLAIWFAREGLSINLNIVIFTIIAMLLFTTRSPSHINSLMVKSSSVVGPVLLQYPFYAGIMGLMTATGLAEVLAGFFTRIATPETLSFWAFISGGLINMFVPSGGGQWVVQGPVFVQAAQSLGVQPSHVVLGVAYGDQWTNLIQPFWTLPLLAICGLGVRDILGYCFLVLIGLFFVLGGSLLLLGA